MSFPTEAVLLLIFVYTVAWYFSSNNSYNMHRGGFFGHRGRVRRLPVLPSYPEHRNPRTSSKISGSDDAPDASTNANSSNEEEDFYPSLEDVSQVRNMLRQSWASSSSSSTKKRKVALPDEVIDMILDEAEYWPSVVTSLRTTPFVISTDGDRECLRTPPLCYDPAFVDEMDKQSLSTLSHDTSHLLMHRGMYPCRKIVFDISAHDQGWGGERSHQGTFQGSWTWFSAYVSPHRRQPEKTGGSGSGGHTRSPEARSGSSESVSSGSEQASSSDSDHDGSRRSTSSHPRPFLPEPGKLQCNRTATINSTNYHIVWHYRDNIAPDSDEAERIEQETGRGRATLDGSAVRDMQIGDEVSVWLRARFAGWRNHVEKLSVRVFWAA